MALGARELIGDIAIVVETEPVQPIQNRGDGLFGGSCAVGVLDPQQVLAAHAAGKKPIEQSRSRASYVEVAGRRGGKARDDAHGGQRTFFKARAW